LELIRAWGAGSARGLAYGRAAQVDPIKPTLKAPGTRQIKLKYYTLLESFGYNFNLRGFTMGKRYLTLSAAQGVKVAVTFLGALLRGAGAGAYTRPLFGST
jgi:hypothetical protein